MERQNQGPPRAPVPQLSPSTSTMARPTQPQNEAQEYAGPSHGPVDRPSTPWFPPRQVAPGPPSPWVSSRRTPTRPEPTADAHQSAGQAHPMAASTPLGRPSTMGVGNHGHSAQPYPAQSYPVQAPYAMPHPRVPNMSRRLTDGSLRAPGYHRGAMGHVGHRHGSFHQPQHGGFHQPQHGGFHQPQRGSFQPQYHNYGYAGYHPGSSHQPQPQQHRQVPVHRGGWGYDQGPSHHHQRSNAAQQRPEQHQYQGSFHQSNNRARRNNGDISQLSQQEFEQALTQALYRHQLESLDSDGLYSTGYRAHEDGYPDNFRLAGRFYRWLEDSALAAQVANNGDQPASPTSAVANADNEADFYHGHTGNSQAQHPAGEDPSTANENRILNPVPVAETENQISAGTRLENTHPEAPTAAFAVTPSNRRSRVISSVMNRLSWVSAGNPATRANKDDGKTETAEGDEQGKPRPKSICCGMPCVSNFLCKSTSKHRKSLTSSFLCRPRKFKVLVVGDVSTGKTTLINTLMTGQVNMDETKSTEIILRTVNLPINGETVSLEFWDVPGDMSSDDEATLKGNFFHLAIICFSIQQVSNMNDMYQWNHRISRCLIECPVYILGTKADLRPNVRPDTPVLPQLNFVPAATPISYEQGQTTSADTGACAYHECSSYSHESVFGAIEQIITDAIIRQADYEKKKSKGRRCEKLKGTLCFK